MKVLINLLLAFTLAVACKSSKTNTNSDAVAYFVRHAEKANDGTKDPPLTVEGEARARKLAELLEGQNIAAIYTTDYKRTRGTGKVLAEQIGLDMIIYKPNDENFINALKEQIGLKSILVVGHSNSTPTLVNRIIGDEKFKQIDESDYDNLFKVVKEAGKFAVSKESFRP